MRRLSAALPDQTLTAVLITVAISNSDRFFCNAAFKAYLGDQDREAWKQYDAAELAADYSGPRLPPILIDQVGAPRLVCVQKHHRKMAKVQAISRGRLCWGAADPIAFPAAV